MFQNFVDAKHKMRKICENIDDLLPCNNLIRHEGAPLKNNRMTIYKTILKLFVSITIIFQIFLNLGMQFSSGFIVVLFFFVSILESILWDISASHQYGCPDTNTVCWRYGWYALTVLVAISHSLVYLKPVDALHPVPGISDEVAQIILTVKGLMSYVRIFYICMRYYQNPKVNKSWVGKLRLFVMQLILLVVRYGSSIDSDNDKAKLFNVLLFYGTLFGVVFVDSFCERFLHSDFSMDMAASFGLMFIVGGIIIAMIVMVRLILPPAASSSVRPQQAILMFMLGGVSYVAISTGAYRCYQFRDMFAAYVFTAHISFNFGLEFVFINASAASSDFWMVLLVTAIFYACRNTGYFEDIVEWFNMRFHENPVRKALVAFYSMLNEKMWHVHKEKSERPVREINDAEMRIMFIMKTQSEIIMILSPLVIIVSVLTDYLFVYAFDGVGTVTYGLRNEERVMILLVFLIILGVKSVVYVFSRNVLNWKRSTLTKQLLQLESVDIKDMTSSQLEFHNSILEYVTARLRINRVYLMSLLLELDRGGQKYRVSSSVVESEVSVKHQSSIYEQPITTDQEDQYSEIIIKYLDDTYLFLVCLCGVFFFFIFYNTILYRIDIDAQLAKNVA